MDRQREVDPATQTGSVPPRSADNVLTVLYAVVYIAFVAKTVGVRDLRAALADLLDEVADRREHVVVTRHGRPAAVLIPVEEYDALEETAEILSDVDTLAAIDAGLADVQKGETVTLTQLRREIRQQRR